MNTHNFRSSTAIRNWPWIPVLWLQTHLGAGFGLDYFLRHRTPPALLAFFPRGYRGWVIWLMSSDPGLISIWDMSMRQPISCLNFSTHPVIIWLMCNYPRVLWHTLSPSHVCNLTPDNLCFSPFIVCVLATGWYNYFCNHLLLGGRILQ